MAVKDTKAPRKFPEAKDPVVAKWLELNFGRWTLEETQDAIEIASALRGRPIEVPGVPPKKHKAE
jgi:hypothetical protein